MIGFDTLLVKQSTWTREDLYDAVFTVRMFLAVVMGIGCGFGQLEGLYVFLSFLGLNFVGPNSWLGYQQVTISDYDDEKNPLSMEGFGQAISLFVLSWVTSYSLLQ